MDVRKFVSDFIKQVSKTLGKGSKEYIPSFLSTLAYLTSDSSTVVVKRVLLALSGQSARQRTLEAARPPLTLLSTQAQPQALA